jgi:hypothetical protein
MEPDKARLEKDITAFWVRAEYGEKLEAAAKKYLYSKVNKVIGLAALLESWRYWDTHGRPVEDLASDPICLHHAIGAQKLIKLEDDAKRSADYVFFRNYSDACKALNELPKGKNIAQPMDTYGAVVVACRKLFEKSGEPPTKRMVQEQVGCWYREGGKDPVSDHQWRKIWRAPLIAALLRKS